MRPASINPSAYKYSICGLSMIGPMTKYTDMINTKYGMMIGTYDNENYDNDKQRINIIIHVFNCKT